MGRFITYAAMVLVLAMLDMVWLLWIARDWYQQAIGHFMAPQPNLVAAALFYLAYPVGLMIFAVLPGQRDGAGKVALLGGLLGLFAYGTYDLTNLAILKDWPWHISLIDVAWGTVASALCASIGGYFARVTA